MPYIKVDINELELFRGILDDVQKRFYNIDSRFVSVVNSINSTVKSSDNIISNAVNIHQQLSLENQSLTKMAAFVSNAKNIYACLDDTNAKRYFAPSPYPSSVSKSSSSALKTAGKFIGKMGFVGTAVSGIIDLSVSGRVGGSAKSIVDFIKSGKNVVKGLVDWEKAAKNRDAYARFGNVKAAKGKYWKSAFGMNDVFSGKASRFRANWAKGYSVSALAQNAKMGLGKGWGTRFSRNFSKNMKSQVGSYAKGAKSAFSWIGLGLNLAGNAISNYSEAKKGEISTTRAVAETIMETAVDTATGWVIGAGVAAGLAATIGSAPVLLVGAATVGITIGLDYACKKITGAITGTQKGLTETISDVILDVGKAISKKKKKIFSGARKLICKLFK